MKFANLSFERKLRLALSFAVVLVAGAAILAVVTPRMNVERVDGSPEAEFPQNLVSAIGRVTDIDNCLLRQGHSKEIKNVKPQRTVGRNKATHTLWFDDCGGITLVVSNRAGASEGKSFAQKSEMLANDLWSVLAHVSANALFWGENQWMISRAARAFHDQAGSYGLDYRLVVQYRSD